MKMPFDLRRLQFPYELIMAALAFVNLYFYYFQFSGVLDPSGVRMAAVIDVVTICIFAVDYLVRFIISADKKRFFTTHIFDLLAIIPVSPGFRGLRLVRCIVLFCRFVKRLRHISSFNMFLYVAFGAVVVLFTSALLIAPLENMTFFEGLWWGVVTIATVGYGDYIPVTTPGRIIAIVLMLSGIGFLSFLTGTITTYYVNTRVRKVGIESSRGVLRHYQKQLLHFHEMTEEDIDDMHQVLKALKGEMDKKEMTLTKKNQNTQG